MKKKNGKQKEQKVVEERNKKGKQKSEKKWKLKMYERFV